MYVYWCNTTTDPDLKVLRAASKVRFNPQIPSSAIVSIYTIDFYTYIDDEDLITQMYIYR